MNDLAQQNVQTASDCKTVIDDITNGSLGFHAVITKEINQRSESCSECLFTLDWRNSNYEAHIIPKFASSLSSGHHVWLGVPYDTFSIPVNISFDQ